MKRILLIILLALPIWSQAQKVNGVRTVTPATIITDSTEQFFAAMGWVNNFFSSKRYGYYRSDNQGILFHNGGWLGLKNTDSALVAIPTGWASYVPPCQFEDREHIGNWIAGGVTYRLEARTFGDGKYWLTQVVNTDPETFAVRAWSMLDSNSVTIVRTIGDDCETIQNGLISGSNGLEKPSTFTTPSGYYTYNAIDGTPLFSIEEQIISSNVVDRFVSFTPTTVPNSVNLEQFPDITPPSKLRFIFGHGSPLFTEMATTPALQLKKGWTHSSNSGAYGTSVFPAGTNSIFTLPATGSNSGDLVNIANNLYGKNLFQLSTTEAREVGRTFANNKGTIQDPTAPNFPSTITYSRPVNHFHFDEELLATPPNYWVIMGNIINGVADRLTNENALVFYGRATSYNLINGNPTKYPDGFTDAEIDALHINPFSYAGAWESPNFYLDISGGYYRVPISPDSTYYKKDGNGNYLLSAGKRVIRDTPWTETINGETVEFLHGPSDQKRYLQINETTGAGTYGNPQDVLLAGHYWAFNEGYNRNPNLFVNDAYYIIWNQYRMHDKYQLNLRQLNRHFLNGVPDISRWREFGTKPIGVIRPESESFTYSSNSHIDRPLSPASLKLQVYQGVMMGVHGFETWEPGTGGEFTLDNPASGNSTRLVRPKGDPIYYDGATPIDEKWSKYEYTTAALQGVIGCFKGVTFDQSLRYVHFSKYVKSFQNKEILSNGFYQGDSLSFYAVNPWHDPTDTTSIELNLGGLDIVNFDLIGREPLLTKIKIPTGLEPVDFTMRYNNIDGNEIHVTGDIDQHYASDPIVIPGGIPEYQWNTLASRGYKYNSYYEQGRAERSNGVAIFNWYGNPGFTDYPAPNPCCDAAFPSFTNDYVLVEFPSHSINYAGDGKVGMIQYQLKDASGNIVMEVYDTRGGTGVQGDRANNHYDDTARWVKKGVYTFVATNISEEQITMVIRAGTTADLNGDSIFSENVSSGSTITKTLDFTNNPVGTEWHSWKINCNIYP